MGARIAAHGSTRRLILALAVFAALAPGAWVRATYATRTTADEPHYLLTATSLFEDGDLNVADERAALRYLPYHETALLLQATIRADGSQIVPHDLLLPVLLAVPMGVGGWLGAKLFMATMAAGLAVLMAWTAERRLGVPPLIASIGAFLLCCSPPIAVYATQVYPELPAALVALGAVVVATADHPSTRRVAATVSLVMALPWLSVKYVPVAATIAGVALWWWTRATLRRASARRLCWGALGGWALGGVAYLLVHRVLYGGWTVYAAGSHFLDGERTVMGSRPDYLGRSVRLVGLLFDDTFGLAVWQPAFLFAVPAAVAMISHSRRWAAALLGPAGVGWLVATFAALTMRGWWFPGRQVVVVVPLLALPVLWWLGRLATRGCSRTTKVAIGAAAFAGFLGVGSYAMLVVESWRGARTWVSDFWETANPAVRLLRAALPDLRHAGPGEVLACVVAVLVSTAAVLLTARMSRLAAAGPGC